MEVGSRMEMKDVVGRETGTLSLLKDKNMRKKSRYPKRSQRAQGISHPDRSHGAQKLPYRWTTVHSGKQDGEVD